MVPKKKKKKKEHIPVFNVHASIKQQHTNQCGQVHQHSINSPQVAQATIRDGGASYALTCLRCLPKVWQLNCTVYIQQHQYQFSRLFFCLRRLKFFHRFYFPSVFGTRAYFISFVFTMLMRSSFPSGNLGTFLCEIFQLCHGYTVASIKWFMCRVTMRWTAVRFQPLCQPSGWLGSKHPPTN